MSWTRGREELLVHFLVEKNTPDRVTVTSAHGSWVLHAYLKTQ
jgi:hypothetical protein